MRSFRWPKGPFPTKYKWEAVEAKLRGRWPSLEEEVNARLATVGAVPSSRLDDPFVRSFRADASLEELRRATSDLDAFVFAARKSDAFGVVASREPLVAVVAVGVGSPAHGLGTAGVIRLLMALRNLGPLEIRGMEEDWLDLDFAPRDADLAQAVSDRVLELCPPLCRVSSGGELARRMLDERRLTLDWFVPRAADGAR